VNAGLALAVNEAAPRHILMTADAVGGVWQYATDLCAVLGAAGHRVTLAVLGPAPSEEQRREAARIEGLSLVETALPLDWLSARPEPIEQAARDLAELARQERVDLVHCNMPTLAGAAAFPAPLVAVTHGCVATWWQAARDGPLPPTFEWHKRMMARGLSAADAVVAPSAAYAEMIRRTYALPAAPLVVHNGRRARGVDGGDAADAGGDAAAERTATVLDAEAAPPGERAIVAGSPAAGRGSDAANSALPWSGAARSASVAPGAEPLHAALTVGRLWDPVKQAALLDRVAAGLSLPFLAAGACTGPHGEHFAPAHLQALGQVDGAALGALLARRPMFVSAATFEPFGLAVLEAAQAGCALVLSDIASFRELWDGAAIFVPPGEAGAFAAAIERIAAEPALRAELGAAAAARAARYTPEASGAAMMRLYAEVHDSFSSHREVAA